jgi:Xaa-Pro aminopeptidase
MTTVPDFKAHRDSLLDQLQPDEAVLLIGGPHYLRNGDAEYRYRPDSDVYWATGWEDPEVAVFLRPGEHPFTLFCQPKDPNMEIWNGFRHGLEGAQEVFGADVSFKYSELAQELPRLIQGVKVLHYEFARDADNDQLLVAAIRKAARAARKNGLAVPQTFHSLSKLVHELRLSKTERELDVMREAARITGIAHRRAMTMAKPDMTEFQVESEIIRCFIEEGGNGPGYTSIVAGGENACTLHYIRNRAPLQDGDLLLIDAGGEFGFYTADVTRTFPVNGKFSPPQRQVYEWVLRAQKAAIDECIVGSTPAKVHETAVRVLTEGMLDLKLLSGELDELIAEEKYKKYYMHGTGHWLGLDVHDVGLSAIDGKSRKFQENFVLTVEPGLYIPADDETAPKEFRGIGIRIEDDIRISAEGPENLTADIPKEIADIEAIC